MKRCLAGAALAAGAAAQSLNCFQDFPDLGVTYDLTPLSGTGRPITMVDNRNNSLAVFSYVMGVCTDIDPTDPAYSNQLAACVTTQNDDGSATHSGPSPAFQVGVGFNSCKRLGDKAANGRFNLLVSPDHRYRSQAASGIQLQYFNGDSCVDPFNASNLIPRSVVMNFQCYDSPIIQDKGVVEETGFCTYFATIPNRYGCPLQCARNRGRVCSANGICGYDVTGGYAKCFCNKGYSGADCSTSGDKGLPPPTDYSGNIAGGFFGGVVGGLVLAVGVFVGKAMMGGLTWRDGLDLDFGHFSSAVRPAPGAAGSYAKAPGAPMFTGSGDGYAPPAEGYAPPGSGDGPLLA